MKDELKSTYNGKNRFVRNFIFISIVLVWVAGMIISFVTDYVVPSGVTALVASVVGWFSLSTFKRGGTKK